ncbi:MAG: sugar ABC transporter permease [Roseiflexaceae bacterium]|nr:sugar ABC transporter permease [Roseiflexaceae bacterium]
MQLSIRRREELWFYTLISPWVLGFLAFTAGPLLASLFFSFTRYDVVSPPIWTGLQNYARLLEDDLFLQALKVTTLYTIITVPLGIVVSLGLALLLNRDVPGIRFFRTAIYLPTVTSGVALALLWMWLFNPEFGLINYGVAALTGWRGPLWLQSETWVLPALVLMALWGVGGTVVIYLAGLQGIPTELYEAAELDGATGVTRLWSITLPLLSPVIFFTTITGMIGTFQVFTTIKVATNGGPNYASLVYVVYLYNVAFRDFQMGYASALAWVLFIIVLLLTLLAFRSSASWVHYEDEERR